VLPQGELRDVGVEDPVDVVLAQRLERGFEV